MIPLEIWPMYYIPLSVTFKLQIKFGQRRIHLNSQFKHLTIKPTNIIHITFSLNKNKKTVMLYMVFIKNTEMIGNIDILLLRIEYINMTK